VVQEVGSGAVESPLSDFDEALYARVRMVATPAQIAAAIEFSEWLVEFNQGYGVLSIVGDGLDDLTGLHLSFGTYGRMVCSAATARTAERLGLIPDRDPAAVQPANLAKYFRLSKLQAQAALVAPAPITDARLRCELRLP